MRLLVLVVAVALAGTSSATACPIGTTPCPTIEGSVPIVTVGYTRTGWGLPTAASGPELMRFLTEATWTPFEIAASNNENANVSRTIWFADPKQPLDARILRGRTRFITRVTWTAKNAPVIEIDGKAFTLEPCPGARKSACLVLRENATPRELGIDMKTLLKR